MKDEFLYVMFEGLESAMILRKNLEGSRAWTQKDVRKAYKRGYVQGFDVSLDNDWPTTVNMKMVQSVYISDEDVPLNEAETALEKEINEAINDEIMDGYL